jgi:hypothetical protein
MTRPIGVTASALVAVLGSIFALAFAAAGIASLFTVPQKAQPPDTHQAIIASAAMLVALAAAGIWTSVGLFRLRSWARTSILIFAGFLAGMSIFGLVITMVVPIPADISTGTRQIFHQLMAAGFGIPLLVAVWWLIQFNTQPTKAAFSSAVGYSASPRPMSITVIAVAMLITSVWCLLLIAARAKIFVLGATFDDWRAVVVYAILGALSLYIAKGLKDLRERARVLAIAWLDLWLLHSSLITLVPSLRHRLELAAALPNGQQVSIPFDMGVLINASLVVVAIMTVAGVWFLIRDRAAFARAENARDWPGLHG